MFTKVSFLTLRFLISVVIPTVERGVMGISSKNGFRKIVSQIDEVSNDKSHAFRKSISERVVSQLNAKSFDRVFGHDILYLD